MNLRPYLEHVPVLGERVYVDPAASVIGEVVLGDDVSIWPGCVVRGDVNFIRIGARTNIQDGTIVHVSHDGPHAKLGGFATVIGDDVTIGHKAIIHACRIEDAALIGMGAIVLDGAVVQEARLRRRRRAGRAGQGRRRGRAVAGQSGEEGAHAGDAEIEALYYSAQHYVRLKDHYLTGSAL